MGKKKRTGMAKQTIPKVQKLDPDSSEEEDSHLASSGNGAETVLKLDDDDHSTMSSGASGDTYTYSQREFPVTQAQKIANIHDDARIEQETDRMQRTETLSGWNRGRALKEVGVEIPKDDKLYAKEYMPTDDLWGNSGAPNPEESPWMMPIPLPLLTRSNPGNQPRRGSIASPAKASTHRRQNATPSAAGSAIPSSGKIQPHKTRPGPNPVALDSFGVTTNPTRALGDRTNSGSYAAAVPSNTETDQKSRIAIAEVQQRVVQTLVANTTDTNDKTPAADYGIRHKLDTGPARVTSGASTLGELAKMSVQPEGTSELVFASNRNISGGVITGVSTLGELIKSSEQVNVSSAGPHKGKGKARQLSGAAAIFHPAALALTFNHSAQDLWQDLPGRELTQRDGGIDGCDSECHLPAVRNSNIAHSAMSARIPALESKAVVNLQVIADDQADVPRTSLNGFAKPVGTPGAATKLDGATENCVPHLKGTYGLAEQPSQMTTDIVTASTITNPDTSIRSSESSSSKVKTFADKKTMMHTKPSRIPEPEPGVAPVIYTATTTTTASGAKITKVDHFEYDYLYPIFTVEIRAGTGSTPEHTVAWYHPNGIERSVAGLEEYLQVVFDMTEISLYVDYKCDETGRKMRADVFWPGLDNWVPIEVRGKEGMGV